MQISIIQRGNFNLPLTLEWDCFSRLSEPLSRCQMFWRLNGNAFHKRLFARMHDKRRFQVVWVNFDYDFMRWRKFYVLASHVHSPRFDDLRILMNWAPWSRAKVARLTISHYGYGEFFSVLLFVLLWSDVHVELGSVPCHVWRCVCTLEDRMTLDSDDVWHWFLDFILLRGMRLLLYNSGWLKSHHHLNAGWNEYNQKRQL